jgi:glycosyltransferase involved in cell wall biosynthesis
VRICVAYDCLYPYTVGGAERWYRRLAERLAAEGHSVTYLTLRQWPRDDHPELVGVEVITVGAQGSLYGGGRRRVGPPLRFGLGVFRHLRKHGGRYDVVHMASFPYFSVLCAAAARRSHGFALYVDWHEVWTRDYWRDYLGRIGGTIGWLVQRRCARVRQTAFCFSRLHAERLRRLGFAGTATILEGEYVGEREPAAPVPAEPVVVFAGRHIPEKRVPALVRALPLARKRIPELRARIFGDGPERARVRQLVAELGLDGSVEAPGFVEAEVVDAALQTALCLVLPSRREGYGLVVVEAAAVGTPSVVVRDPDNAAVELVDEGQNGVIAASADPADLAEAIVCVHELGDALRQSTADWFRRNADRLSLDHSLATVLAAYARASAS